MEKYSTFINKRDKYSAKGMQEIAADSEEAARVAGEQATQMQREIDEYERKMAEDRVQMPPPAPRQPSQGGKLTLSFY